MKIIKRLLLILAILLTVWIAVLAGVYWYIRAAYGIDVIHTVRQVKTLTRDVDDNAFPQSFSNDDLMELKTGMDEDISGLITYEEGTGYNGYSVDLSKFSEKEIPEQLRFRITEKQTGALAQTVLYSQTDGVVSVGNADLELSVVQVNFSEIDANGSADVNVVVKLDLTNGKDQMNTFPLSLLRKWIPNALYVSSTIRVNKTDDAFGYLVTHRSLTINSLSAEDTEELFHTLDVIFKIGTAEQLNTEVGTLAMDALIGTEENPGFAYSLHSLGATSFAFATEDGSDCFIIYGEGQWENLAAGLSGLDGLEDIEVPDEFQNRIPNT